MQTLLALVTLLLCVAVGLCNEPLQIETKSGIIEGYKNSSGKYFFGVPYAEPPIGNNRFRAPQTKEPWQGVLQTKVPRDVCVQPAGRGNEDCLYMNVYAPAGNKTNLPIMIWLHGGAFQSGHANQYDGDSFSKFHDTIVVSVNYRLGLFGFLYVLELTKEGPSGLYGVLDQRAAIQWVHDNIATLGGDSNKITLFGESAGGTSVLFHVVSPKTPKIARAIAQSGTLSEYTPDRARLIYSLALRELNCSQNILQCLRSPPTSAIVKAQQTIKPLSVSSAPVFRPVLHPEEMPLPFTQAFSQGKFNHIPLMIGANLNEASYFLCPAQENLTLPQYYAFLGYEFGLNRAMKIAEKYPASKYESPKWALSHVLSDYIFKCPALEIAKSASRIVPTYFYHFEFLAGFASKCHRVSHGYELPFLFDQFGAARSRGYTFTRRELDFKTLMKKMWFTFVNGGDNGWNKFDSNKKNFVRLNEKVDEGNNFLGETCEFWRNFNKN